MRKKVLERQAEVQKGYCEKKEEQGAILEKRAEEKANIQIGIKAKQRRDVVNDDDKDGKKEHGKYTI